MTPAPVAEEVNRSVVVIGLADSRPSRQVSYRFVFEFRFSLGIGMKSRPNQRIDS
jgi:hypothetical protein